ncbi:hypothetical protein COB72_09850 [bacterium]|nr:MAG: hypothetical protein COB72_09850 [bacterium]
MKMKFVGSCALIGALTAASAADVATWDDRDSFLLNLGGTAIHDDFETYGINVAPGARTLSFNGFDATYDGNDLFGIDDVVNLGHGTGPTSGAQYLLADFGSQSARSLTFSFSELVSDFGVYIRDVELTSLSYETDSGLSGMAVNLASNDVIQFFGLTTGGDESLAFSTITFTMLAQSGTGQDGVMFDQLTYVPTPGSLALIGFGGLAMSRRRR